MSSKTLLDFKSLVSDATSSLCGNFLNSLLKFPATFYTWLASVAETGGDIRGVAKIGDYRFSASPLLEDSYWKLANGQAISRTTYADLFTLIGVVYGVGDNSTTFNLPNAGARSLIGVGALPSTTAIALGDTIGEENHKLTRAEGADDPDHVHVVGRFEEAVDDDLVVINGSKEANTNGLLVKGAGGSRPVTALDSVVGDWVNTFTAADPVDEADIEEHNNIHPVIAAYIYIRVA